MRNVLFRTNKFISQWLGFIKTEIRLDETLQKLKYAPEDMDLFLQHMFLDHKVIRFEKICTEFLYRVESQTGGVDPGTSIRPGVEYVRKKWGKDLIGLTKDGRAWPIRSPFRGL